MPAFNKSKNSDCQRCKQVIAKAAESIRASCYSDSDGCCWGDEYDIKFNTDPCTFAKTYKSTLSAITKRDKDSSNLSKELWDSCVKNNIEAVNHCRGLGFCQEVPPGPNFHASMVKWCEKSFSKAGDQTSCWECIENNSPCNYSDLSTICSNMHDCRSSTKLDLIDPPTGELAHCLRDFASDGCCKNTKTQNTKGMNANQKQYFWESFRDGVPNTTSPPQRSGGGGGGLPPVSDQPWQRETGACCWGNNYCDINREIDCNGMHGASWRGAGSDCSACPTGGEQIPGACCYLWSEYPWETCHSVYEYQCVCHEIDPSGTFSCQGTQWHGEGSACHEAGETSPRCNNCSGGPPANNPSQCSCRWKDNRDNDPDYKFSPMNYDKRLCESMRGVFTIAVIENCHWRPTGDGPSCYCTSNEECFGGDDSCCCQFIHTCTGTVEFNGHSQDFTRKYGCGWDGDYPSSQFSSQQVTCVNSRRSDIRPSP